MQDLWSNFLMILSFLMQSRNYIYFLWHGPKKSCHGILSSDMVIYWCMKMRYQVKTILIHFRICIPHLCTWETFEQSVQNLDTRIWLRVGKFNVSPTRKKNMKLLFEAPNDFLLLNRWCQLLETISIFKYIFKNYIHHWMDLYWVDTCSLFDYKWWSFISNGWLNEYSLASNNWGCSSKIFLKTNKFSIFHLDCIRWNGIY